MLLLQWNTLIRTPIHDMIKEWFQKQYTNMGINWEGNMRMFIFTGSCLLSFICEGIASILTKLFTHNDSRSLLSSVCSPWRFPSVSLQEPRSLGEVPCTAPRPWPRNFPSPPNRLSFQPPYPYTLLVSRGIHSFRHLKFCVCRFAFQLCYGAVPYILGNPPCNSPTRSASCFNFLRAEIIDNVTLNDLIDHIRQHRPYVVADLEVTQLTSSTKSQLNCQTVC